MKLIEAAPEEKEIRAKKMMLWFGIISMIMTFGGLTSAYIVRSSEEDWLKDYQLPQIFLWSTLVILTSSFSIQAAKSNITKGERSMGTAWLIVTLVLGMTFIGLQFKGFGQIIDQGYYFTGLSSNVTTSFIYVLALSHIAHVVVGIVVLLVVLFKHVKGKYDKGRILGLSLATTFWHFVDALWLYLFLFLYFYERI